MAASAPARDGSARLRLCSASTSSAARTAGTTSTAVASCAASPLASPAEPLLDHSEYPHPRSARRARRAAPRACAADRLGRRGGVRRALQLPRSTRTIGVRHVGHSRRGSSAAQTLHRFACAARPVAPAAGAASRVGVAPACALLGRVVAAAAGGGGVSGGATAHRVKTGPGPGILAHGNNTPPRRSPSPHHRARRFAVPSVAPREPLSRSESPRRRVGRAPRAGAQAQAERDACGWPAGALGVRAPRAIAESAAAFMRRSSLGVWRRFVRPVRRPARAALSLRGPAPAGRARGRARARCARTSLVALAAAVEQGCSRHCGDLLLFSVAGRRPCLASFLWSPLRAERGSGARSDRRRARDARGARVHHGWLSPPQSSRGVRALCSSSTLPLLFVSVAPRVPLPRSTRAVGWRAHHERSSRPSSRARRSLAPSPCAGG